MPDYPVVWWPSDGRQLANRGNPVNLDVDVRGGARRSLRVSCVMTVAELIKALQLLSPDAPVVSFSPTLGTWQDARVDVALRVPRFGFWIHPDHAVANRDKPPQKVVVVW